jgi:hypothetical protein
MSPAPTSASELAAGLKTERFFRLSDCVPELYAYTSVVSLAKKLRSDHDVFDETLTDLREQLIACLSDQEGKVIPIHQPGAC